MSLMLKIFATSSLLFTVLVGCKDPSSLSTPSAKEGSDAPTTPGYLTYNDALTKAKNERKHVLLVFTGSDWCDYSKALERDVLTEDSWKSYADESFLVYHADIPLSKALPSGLLEQNKMLQKKCRITSFPSILIIDPVSGQEKGRCGYIQDGIAANYISAIQSLLTQTSTAPGEGPVKLSGADIHATTGTDRAVTYLKEGHRPGDWTADLDSAIKAAADSGLPILMKFTNTEDCTWCTLMNEKVLSQASWQRFARTHLVQVALDFRTTPPQPEAVRKRNTELKNTYSVQGFPTFILFEPDGKNLVAYVEHDLSPRGFRKRVQAALELSEPHVAAVSAKLAGSESEDYRRTIKETKAAMADKRELDRKSQELFLSGGITKEFSETYKEAISRLNSLEREIDQYSRKQLAAELESEEGRRYLRLSEELVDALNRRDTLSTSSTSNRETALALADVIALITSRLEEIEIKHRAKSLPADAADLYQKLYAELKGKRRDYASWLATDPPSNELNNARDTIFQREINQLQDRMDAIRDLQSKKGGPQ